MILQSLTKSLYCALSLPTSSKRMVSTISTKTRGYAFGLATNNGQSLISLAPYNGKVLVRQDVNNAAYQENVADFSTAFIYEFPSLNNAQEWQRHRGMQGGDDLTVVLEDEEFGSDFRGFSIFFVKVEDWEKFAKYNPNESLSRYVSKRSAVKIADVPDATGAVKKFDAAVLIAFPTAETGKTWLESDEYKPQGDLRKETSSGHGIVIG